MDNLDRRTLKDKYDEDKHSYTEKEMFEELRELFVERCLKVNIMELDQMSLKNLWEVITFNTSWFEANIFLVLWQLGFGIQSVDLYYVN